MKNVLLGVGGVMVVMLLFVGAFFLTWMLAHNSEVSARNAFDAQQKANESSFDKTWKVIQQTAQVPVAERDSFRKTYTEIMSATKGVAGNGQLASFFTQAKIDISPDLFAKLMTTIEAQRESFHRDQQHLLKLAQQHKDILTRQPSAFFVGSRPKLEVKLVISQKTTEAFESGQDNNINLFEKNGEKE